MPRTHANKAAHSGMCVYACVAEEYRCVKEDPKAACTHGKNQHQPKMNEYSDLKPKSLPLVDLVEIFKSINWQNLSRDKG